MRYIYMDEAGTSANEPVTVVVGVIVDADSQIHLAETELRNLKRRVPTHFRAGFHIHAKEIWGNHKYRGGWSQDERKQFLIDAALIPRRLKLGLAFATVRRSAGWGAEGLARSFASPTDYHHFLAFHHAICRADKYMRDRAGPNEVATVVAEDVGSMKLWLKRALIVAREVPMTYPPEGQNPTLEQRTNGALPIAQVNFVERIKDTIFFAEKSEAPLLQIADVCAFGLRRFFAEQSFGDELARAIVGYDLHRPDWEGPTSAGIIGF